MGKSARQGNFVDNAVNNFADNGGIVKALGTAVLAPGISDLVGGVLGGGVPNDWGGGWDAYGGGPDIGVNPQTVPDIAEENLLDPSRIYNNGNSATYPPVTTTGIPNLPPIPRIPTDTQPPAPVSNGTPTMNPGNPAPGTPGYVPGGASAAQGLLSKILNGTATADDYTKLLGTLGSTGLGLLGSDAQRSAYNSAADKYLALGEPSRARLEASYQPGFSMANEPGYKDALDQGTQSFLRAASAGNAPGVSSGNPFGNPGAWAETQKYVDNNFTLPQLNNYRNQNAAQGGLGLGIAGTNSTAGAQQTGNGYTTASYGLDQLTNPQSGIDAWLKKLGGGLGGLGGFSLNLGKGLT